MDRSEHVSIFLIPIFYNVQKCWITNPKTSFNEFFVPSVNKQSFLNVERALDNRANYNVVPPSIEFSSRR